MVSSTRLAQNIGQSGLDTVYSITAYWAKTLGTEQLKANAAFLKEYVDRGDLGVKTGRGFYDYPNPA